MNLTFKPKSPEELRGFYAAREDEQLFEYFMQFCELHEVRWGGDEMDARHYTFGQAIHLHRDKLTHSGLDYAERNGGERLTLSDLFYTVEELLAAGHKMIIGDRYIDIDGETGSVGTELFNKPEEEDCNRYVLSASALMGDNSDAKSSDDKVYAAPLIGEAVFISKNDYELSEHELTFIGKEVRVAGYFTTQPTDDDAEPVKMVAVSKSDGGPCCFRLDMIETPEQKAARERHEAIKEMMAHYEQGGINAEQLMGKLYDAGYRKEK